MDKAKIKRMWIADNGDSTYSNPIFLLHTRSCGRCEARLADGASIRKYLWTL